MNTDNSNVSEYKTPKKHYGCLVLLMGGYFSYLIIIYLFLSILVALRLDPLPSDEKMIAHFQAHRVEFEELVKNHKSFVITHEHPVFENFSQNKSLMKNAAIKRVTESGIPWFSNPYSTDAAKEFEVRRKRAKGNALEFTHPLKNIEFSMEDHPLGKSRQQEILLLAGIQKMFEFNKHSLWEFVFLPYIFMREVSKTYMYIPETPKIEDDLLQYPVTSTGKPVKKSDRVFSSLTFYPLFWNNGECVYRQIEPYWFIKLCNH